MTSLIPADVAPPDGRPGTFRDDPPDLAGQAIAVKIRWFGLVVGYAYANAGAAPADPLPLNAILAVGLGFTVLDTAYSAGGRVFLGTRPRLIAVMEALFIGLLCYFDRGADSPFRYYYILSLICSAVRNPGGVTAVGCGLHAASFGAVYLAEPAFDRKPFALLLMLVVLAWVAWAAASLARLLRRAADQLRTNQVVLEQRIVERTRELEESQAQVFHQEKMAGFGLLAAGIAHEVGNPLAGISGIVQLLDRRENDAYTRERLAVVTAQLARIRTTLHELVAFSRPPADARGRVHLADVVAEALSIAKYYQGVKARRVTAVIPDVLPMLVGVRDQLVQVVFNLLLNAVDATGRGGTITVTAEADAKAVTVTVSDDGPGVPADAEGKLFRPYFTTKKHGTGLGLFVSRKLAVGHGGDLTYHPGPGGIGAAFRLTLPRLVK